MTWVGRGAMMLKVANPSTVFNKTPPLPLKCIEGKGWITWSATDILLLLSPSLPSSLAFTRRHTPMAYVFRSCRADQESHVCIINSAGHINNTDAEMTTQKDATIGIDFSFASCWYFFLSYHNIPFPVLGSLDIAADAFRGLATAGMEFFLALSSWIAWSEFTFQY